MNKKSYSCSECGYIYPSELSELINKEFQVFCEKCGTPFSIKGIIFKPYSSSGQETAESMPKTGIAQSSGFQKEWPRDWLKESKFKYKHTEKDRKTIRSIIHGFNKFTYIPIYIISGVIFGILIYDIILIVLIAQSMVYLSLFNFISRGFLGFACLLIARYDQKYIAKKIKEEKYHEIMVDAFCWGILGCIFYGIGVFLLLKGLIIILYNLLERKNIAHDLKDSLNHFSSKAGFVIIFLIISYYLNTPLKIQVGSQTIEGTIFQLGIFYILVVGILIFLGIIMLIIDMKWKKKIEEKKEFQIGEIFPVLIIGIIGVASFATGIFILFKGIILLIMVIVKPEKKIEPKREIEQKIPARLQEEPSLKDHITMDSIKPISEEFQTRIELTKQETKMIKEQVQKTEKLKKELKKAPTPDKEYELKLHESLLPVNDEKDKELIKEYFTKIFSVLSKDIKNEIKKLKISKKEKNELLKEIAFLTREEQVKYIEAIISLYQDIPKKLIERIRKLPNVKPKHYDQIVDQLKYLDSEEQLKFIQFLEENA